MLLILCSASPGVQRRFRPGSACIEPDFEPRGCVPKSNSTPDVLVAAVPSSLSYDPCYGAVSRFARGYHPSRVSFPIVIAPVIWACVRIGAADMLGMICSLAAGLAALYLLFGRRLARFEKVWIHCAPNPLNRSIRATKGLTCPESPNGSGSIRRQRATTTTGNPKRCD